MLHTEITPINGDFTGKDIVSTAQFTRDDVEMVMDEAEEMGVMVTGEGRSKLLEDKLVANLFYEPSTRTFMSFEAAAKRLGADTIATQGVEYSSISKGETLVDTVRTIERYADIITMRHSQNGAAALAAAAIKKPFINGGDGIGEHPTQALLDMFTIREEAGQSPEGLTVTMVGDLKNGRTVHSLARLLSLYGGKLNYVSPQQLRMPSELQTELAATGMDQYETTDLDEVIPESDILYVTRIQKERFTDGDEYERLKDSFTIDAATMRRAKREMLLMHPLPRLGEISPEVDDDPRAVYFDQVENGMYVRMALLALVSGRSIRGAASRAVETIPSEPVILKACNQPIAAMMSTETS